MSSVILLKIESLHVRTVQEKGLKLRMDEGVFHTGPLVASLDESAPMPANYGLLNVTTRSIRLHWSVIVTMPFVADAFVHGIITEKNCAPMRVTFEEEGKVLDDDSGFNAEGPGGVAPGSVLSGVTFPGQENFVRMPEMKHKRKLMHTLCAGKKAPCILTPDSNLELTLSKSLGGGKQRINLTGGFFLVPIMTLT